MIKLYTYHKRLWFKKEIVFLEFESSIVNLLEEDVGEISLVSYRLYAEHVKMIKHLHLSKTPFYIVIDNDEQTGKYVIDSLDDHGNNVFRINFIAVD